MKHFADRLAEAVRRRKTPALVGLDPRFEQLPPAVIGKIKSPDPAAKASAYLRFCRGVIDVVAPLVPAVKPQLAFFEELGPPGMTALAEVVAHAHEQKLLVILDGKRNDIGSTGAAYARGYPGAGNASAWGGDALTVSPYLGEDSLTPFAEVARERGAGIFVLVKTSNPGSQLMQGAGGQGGALKKVADHVEAMASAHLGRCGYGSVGAVVGATFPKQIVQLRRQMPHVWFLVPGYGSQGGRAADLSAAFDKRGLGAIVNSSRDIIFAHSRPEYAKKFGPRRWQDAVEAATRDMIADLAANTPAGALR